MENGASCRFPGDFGATCLPYRLVLRRGTFRRCQRDGVALVLKRQIIASGVNQRLCICNFEVVGINDLQDTLAFKLMESPAQGFWPCPR